MNLHGMELVRLLAPELVLVGAACFLLMLSLVPDRARSPFNALIAAAALIVALWITGNRSHADAAVVASLNADSLVWFTRVATFSMGLLILLAARHVPEPHERPEFFALMLFSLAGVSLVAAANNLVLLFLALEMVSVPTYVLVGLSRRDIRAQEATVKYFFLGAFAAAVTLYGFSFLYGATGTMRLFAGTPGESSIAAQLAMPSAAASQWVMIGLLLSLMGLAFKLAAVPLHFYAPDVYQGAASPVTGMLGFVPKFAGLLAVVRVLSVAGWGGGEGLFWLLWAMAAVTMTVGNTLALMQNNVKRMLAYSSIAHSGYLLVGVAAGPGASSGPAGPLRDGLTAVLFYVAVYGVMNLGAFAALSFFRRHGEEEEDSVETLDELAGAARRHPWACLALAVCVLSLMGLPPTGGFFGKLYVFSAALAAGDGSPHATAMLALVVIGVLNSAVAAAYYLRIVGACYLRPQSEQSARVFASKDWALRASLAVCAVFVLAVFLRPAVLFSPSRESASAMIAPDDSAAAAAEVSAGH